MPCAIQAQGYSRFGKGVTDVGFLPGLFSLYRNGFLEIVYFLWRNIWMVVGLLSIGYIFLAEQLGTKNT